MLTRRAGMRQTREDAVIDVSNAIPEDGRILFFRRDRETFGFLSHFHPAVLVIDGEAWPSAEHFYQAQKSPSPAYRAAIRAAAHPNHAKRLAASPDAPPRVASGSWFRRHAQRPRADWAEVKLDVMRAADWAKFSQNPDLAALLRATAGAELVEDTPGDPFWGVGRDGRGLNWAGRVLMEMRERLG